MLLTRFQKMAAILLVLGIAVLSGGVLAAQFPPGPAAPREPEAARPGEPAASAAAKPGPLPPGAVARFGSPRLQHFSIDRAAAFSPDGKRLATGGANSPFCVWDAASGERVRTYNNRASILDLRWRADGKLSVVTFFNHDGFLMQEFGVGTPDLTREQEEKRWHEVRERERILAKNKVQPDRLDYCYLSADGRRVVAIWVQGPKNRRRAAVYRFAHAHTSTSAKPEREVPLPVGYGTWLSSDGKVLLAQVLATGGEPNRLRAYHLGPTSDKPAWELTFPGDKEGRRPYSCFSPDGKRVVILFWDEKVEVWDGPSGKRVRELGKLLHTFINHAGERPGIDVSVDGKRVALVARNTDGAESGRVVDVATGAEVCRLTPQPLPLVTGLVRFSADGKKLARVAAGVVAVWNADTGANACPLPGHRGNVNSLAVLRGGKQVVTAGDDRTVRAWEPATGKEVWRALLPQAATVPFATPDGIFLRAKRDSQLPFPCLDAATGKPRPLPGQLAKVRDVFLACSPDGKRVLTLDKAKSAFRIWSWPAGALQTTLPLVASRRLKLVTCRMAHFTPDGKHFAAMVYYSDPAKAGAFRGAPAHQVVETWDVASRRRLRSTASDTRHFPVLIPHATGLYYFGKNGEIRDTVSGQLLVKLQLPANRGISWDFVSGVVLSPDGRTVAARCGFTDGHLLLFETRTGRFREKLPLSEKFGGGLAILPDGRLVSLGGTAMVWAVGLQPAAAGKGKPLEAREQVPAWKSLLDPDPEKAWPAMAKLLTAPEQSVKLIGRHVRPIPKASDVMLTRIIRELDAEEFAKREAASTELERLGSAAVPRVKRELERAASAEVASRLRRFLSGHAGPDLPVGELRSLRAVEILEAAGTPAARKLLAELAGGAPQARLTQEAAAAERRLRGR